MIYSYFRIEGDEFLLVGAAVAHVDLVGVHIDHLALAVGDDLCPGVDTDPLFKAGAHDGGLGAQKRNCLTHHVRSHQGAVGVVVLEERDEGRCHGSHLVRGDVHIGDLLPGDHGEVGLEAALHPLVEDVAVVVHLHVGEGHLLVFLFLCAHKLPAFVAQVHLAVFNLAVGGLDESEVVDLGIYAQRGDKTDVRSFRGFDRAEAAIVGVVDVSDLESCPVP